MIFPRLLHDITALKFGLTTIPFNFLLPTDRGNPLSWASHETDHLAHTACRTIWPEQLFNTPTLTSPASYLSTCPTTRNHRLAAKRNNKSQLILSEMYSIAMLFSPTLLPNGPESTPYPFGANLFPCKILLLVPCKLFLHIFLPKTFET